MEHIRNIRLTQEYTYTVVDTEGWILPLSDHPSVVEHPEVFEVANGYIPASFQWLVYVSDNN